VSSVVAGEGGVREKSNILKGITPMLKQRIITASILIPLTLLILFFLPAPAFLLLTGLITLLAGWEWASLSGLKKPLAKAFYLVFLLLLFGWALYVPTAYILYGALVWWVLATVSVVFYARGEKMTKGVLWRGVAGIFVLLPCWASINFIRNQDPNGLALLLFLFVLVWGADTAAYFVGKK
jgi:phosphatidate cytidylyltransferase